MNRRFFALFLLLCVTLAVVLETRAKKAVAKAKPNLLQNQSPWLRFPVSKPKPVANQSPWLRFPVAKAKPVAKPVSKPKPVAKPATKKPVTAPKQPAPPTSCPVPAHAPLSDQPKKSEESQGQAMPELPEKGCEKAAADANKPVSLPLLSHLQHAEVPLQPVEAEPEQEEPVVEDKPEPVVKKPAKPVKKPAKTEPEPKPVESAAAPARSAAGAREARKSAAPDLPLGTVTNTPTKATGINKNLFPHVFSNFNNEVNLPAACQGKRLEEHAVGPNMAQFRNNAVSIKDFNEFRVLITQPDATGATTFCGVMTHGTLGSGKFEKELCKEA
ncbi:hypothetical protein B0H13DRAFT_1984927 [Mycena leptocephala]|nr:hypothetical protein B0H13DRAFT_1984927 [Mycena leptocephala]